VYFALKNIHMLSIAVSAILLSIRYALVMANPSMIEKKCLKIFPHIVDTILLLSGISLVISLGFIPFTQGNEWFTEKVMCIFVYFALGFFTLHVAKNRLTKTFAFLGALGWLLMAGKIAVTKIPVFMG